MAAPALTPEQIVRMYKTAAFAGQNSLNGTGATIAVKNLVHTTRAGGLRNLPNSYKAFLQPLAKVSPVVTTRGGVKQDNGATPVVNNATNFGLDGFSHALGAINPVVADAGVTPEVVETPTGTPLGFAPGDDFGPMAPNMGLKVDTAQVEPEDKKKPDLEHEHAHEAAMKKLFSNLPAAVQKLVQQGTVSLADAFEKAKLLANDWGEGWPHKFKDGDLAKIFSNETPVSKVADEAAAAQKKRPATGQGTVVAQAAPMKAVPQVHPSPPSHV